MPENMLDKSPDEYIDPKGYWIDPERRVRRMSDEQAVIIQATAECSHAEWERFYEAVVACLDATKR